MTSPREHAFATALAGAFLASDGSPGELRARAETLFEPKPPRFVAEVVQAVLVAWPALPRHDPEALVRTILDVDAFHFAFTAPPDRRLDAPLRMPWLPTTRMGPRRFDVPSIDTVGDLAAWLDLDVGALLWHADRHGWLRDRPEGPLQHHVATWVSKRSGGARLIEAPKSRLRAVQRRILHEILDRVPAHPAAHGYVRGRSVVSFATPHVGRDVVLHLDLEDFFPSTHRRRVERVFASVGYAVPVARELAGLCTTRTPSAVLDRAPPAVSFATRTRLHAPHLAQGAPTSAALSNVCAFGLDVRLDALATAVGATYTRYADDLAFSGDAGFAARILPFARFVAEIVAEEGYRVRADKTRVQGRGQRQVLGGVVVNVHPNAARDEVDRLKAILHHAARTGLLAQDRDGRGDLRARLRGRIAWVAQRNPARGARLLARLDAVPDDPPAR